MFRLFYVFFGMCALLVHSNGFAKSAFDKVTGMSLILGVDDCSSTMLLDKAIRESGVNPLDTTPTKIINCASLRPNGIYSNGGDIDKLCEGGKDVTCYSNSNTSFPSICIANPRTVSLKRHYADTGNVTDYRARFDAIYIFNKEAAGYSHERSWKMDADGCHPVSANLDNPMDSLEDCRKYINAFITGGNMWPINISKEKFCDGTDPTSKIGSILSLHDCYESYPQLYNLMNPRLQNIKSEDKNSTSSSAK